MAFKLIASVALGLGSFVISALLPKKKQKQEPTEPSADYGAPISRFYGDGERKAAPMVWASKLKVKKGKGGGKGKNSNKGLIGSFQVVVGEGVRPAGFTGVNADTGLLVVTEIFFNKVLWWSAAKTGSQNTRRASQFTFYPGSYSQVVDPTLLANLGPTLAAPYQGLAHIVFKDINVSLDSNGNYPTVEVRVNSAIPSTSPSIAQDLFARSSVQQSHPLWTNVHYALSPAYPTGNAAVGHCITMGGSSMSEYLGQLHMVTNTDIGNNLRKLRTTNTRDIHTLELSRRDEVGILTGNAAGRINFSDTISPLPPYLQFESKTSEELPSAVNVSYWNRRNNFETASIRVDNPSSTSSLTVDVPLGFSFANPNVPLAVGRRVVMESGANPTLIKYASPDLYASLRNRFEIFGVDLVDPQFADSRGPDRAGRIYAAVPQKIEFGANGLFEVTLMDTSKVSIASITTLPEPEDQNNTTPDGDGTPEIIWFEGARTLWITASPAGKLVNAIVARPAGSAPLSDDLPLFYTTDGGSTFNAAGSVPGSNAVKFTCSLSATPDPQELEGAVDTVTTVTVTVDSGTSLSSIPLSQIEDPVNTFYTKQWGLCRFLTATLVGPNTYELSDIVWGLFDSHEINGQPPATTSLPFYLLEDRILPVPVSNSVAAGSNFVLSVEYDNIQSTLVSGTFSAPPATFTVFRDLCRAPRPVHNVVISAPSPDITVTWTNGVLQDEYTAFYNVPQTGDVTNNYTIYVYSDSTLTTLLTTFSVTGNSRVITAAEQTTFGITPVSAYEVIETGSPITLGNANVYHFTSDAPFISGFSPGSGGVGASVVITGVNFLGATSLKIGTVSITSFTINSDTQITATIPVGAVTGVFEITTPGGTVTSATSFTVVPAPTITSFAPTAGVPGTSVVITGTNLTGATSLLIGSVPVTSFTIDSATQITATIPAGAVTGVFTVTTPGGPGSSATSFTVNLLPTITGFVPTSGSVGSTVVITGTNFVGVTSVDIGSTPMTSFTVNSATQITATIPVGATTGAISVTNGAGTATGGTYTVTLPVGQNWFVRTVSLANYQPRAVAFSPTLNRYVSVGGSGTLTGTNIRCATSDDGGVTWTGRTISTTNGFTWRTVIWVPELSLFVAGGSGTGTAAIIATSPNGITWTSRTPASNATISSMAWSPSLGLIVAVSSAGASGILRCQTSPNGITWTSRTIPEEVWTGVAWSPTAGRFVAVGQGASWINTSTNGTTWSQPTVDPSAQLVYTSITWFAGASTFVAMSNAGSGNNVGLSATGLSWTGVTGPSNDPWFALTEHVPTSTVYAVAGGGPISKTTDGTAWASVTSPATGTWLGIASSGSSMVAVGSSLSSQIMGSP